MLTDRHRCTNEISFAFASYTAQVQLLAKETYTDSAKAAEDALIEIVNIAYCCNFENLNAVKKNHPGIDWREPRYGTGLQVSVTDTASKRKESVNAVIRNKIKTSKAIWFLTLTTDRYGNSGEYAGYSMQVITMNDLLRQVCSLPDELFFKAVKKIKEKLGPWFLGKKDDVLIPSYKLSPAPHHDFINYHGLWEHLESKEEVPSAVHEQLKGFLESLCNLPGPVRSVIAKIVLYSPTPNGILKPLEIDKIEFYLHLDESEQELLEGVLNVIERKGHGCVVEKNHELADDGLTISYDLNISLNWRVFEPDMNIYSALKIYYLDVFTKLELYTAFEQADFSQLK
ncbi:hypothetical protein BLL42_22295 [Pseudomonas frederiksbergensis]|uniref:SMEK domain-containing protein n=1 Tax=Pseudomonas frederiksbergensis TaxID=104087 RepID=A0A1J0EQV5_9PSED|nr:SMEK domain-containing protein [Pseudomonas frederiksbergensis]APC18319.1 hypothetical protein BLL42_22295 [Pseudomonas frederiksbergensis]